MTRSIKKRITDYSHRGTVTIVNSKLNRRIIVLVLL